MNPRAIELKEEQGRLIYFSINHQCYRNKKFSLLKCKFHRKASIQHVCKDFFKLTDL